MFFRVFTVSVILLWSSISLAAGSCKKTLLHMIEGHSRLVYHIESGAFYSARDLKRMREIFDIGSTDQRHLRFANTGEAIQLINPIYLPITVSAQAGGQMVWTISDLDNLSDHRRHGLGREDYFLFYQLGLKILRHIQEYDPEFFKDLIGKSFEIRFFGVRYFAKRGKTLAGVVWHQHTDAARYQGIILLQKPADLIGGALLLAPSWIEKKVTHFKNGGFSSEPIFHIDHSKEWRFDLPQNRLLTFDGLYAAHATESFGLPEDRKEEIGIRDILGVEIGFPEK